MKQKIYRNEFSIFILSLFIIFLFSAINCRFSQSSEYNTDNHEFNTKVASIILLHHSTGGVIWSGGVSDWFDQYNSDYSTNYTISERAYPKSSPYGWNNYPYDYWNIWVNHAGTKQYMEEDTLEILTASFDIIIWKHCFPVSNISTDTGSPDITSGSKTIENYKLQYNALKTKMLSFPNNRFIVWTGAANVEGSSNAAEAGRAQAFFNWVKNTWDVDGDNIFVWDFWELETEGGLYLLNAYSAGDSHPNSTFAETVAPYLCTRIVDVIQGNGDTGSITGE